MLTPSKTPGRFSLFGWIANKPYILLSLTAMSWAGNAIVGRVAAGHIPPVTLAFIRWTVAFLMVLPFAWRHLAGDWPAIRSRMGTMIVVSVTGIGAFNTLQYMALERTSALNVLVLQTSTPLFIAMWSLVMLGIRQTLTQGIGITVSLVGVLVIVMQGDLGAVAGITFNDGDLIFIVALAIIGFYSAMSQARPPMHSLSFLAFTFGVGALCQLPFFAWELAARPLMTLDLANLLTLAYVVVFPSVLAYLCFNRAVQLIGANRAAPVFHLIPVFGSVMAIFFLGEHLHLYHLAGYLLVLAGVYVTARKPQAAATPGLDRV